jgi:hypothetical protein
VKTKAGMHKHFFMSLSPLSSSPRLQANGENSPISPHYEGGLRQSDESDENESTKIREIRSVPGSFGIIGGSGGKMPLLPPYPP